MGYFTITSIVIIASLILYAFRVLREYERGVIFLLGRFYKVKGPGLIIVIPFVQQIVRVSLRTIVMDVPSQDVISRDNVSVKVNAVVYFRVVDPLESHHTGGKLFGGHQSTGTDHFAFSLGSTRTGRDAGPA